MSASPDLTQNRTTIETFEKVYVSPWPYNKGWRRNLEEVRQL